MSNTRTAYKTIFVANSLADFDKEVERHLDNGWLLQGGVAHSAFLVEDGIHTHFSQSLYKQVPIGKSTQD